LGQDGAYDSSEDQQQQTSPVPNSAGDVDVSLALVVDRVFDGLFQDTDPSRPLESLLQPGGELADAISGTASSLPDPETLHGAYNTLDSWDAFFAYQQAVAPGGRPVDSAPEQHHRSARVEMAAYRDSDELGVAVEAAEDTDRERDPTDAAAATTATEMRFFNLGVGWRQGTEIEADVDDLDVALHVPTLGEFRIRYVEEDMATLLESESESGSGSELGVE
jgi:hypothetical protein